MEARVWEALKAHQWAMQPEQLDVLAAIAARQTDFAGYEALQAERGRPLANARTVQLRGDTENVAVIPVLGPIFPRANLFTMMSGATSTEVLGQDLRTALSNPTIDAIILEIDSPGGAVSGINELADMIHAARVQKPVIAYGQHLVASAAYWIASAASGIVADRTAVLGSIGVIMTVQDSKERDAKSGVRTYEIVSNVSPDKRIDPSADEGRAKLQKVVDDLASVFVETIARNRGISPEAVIENYGRGGTMVGARAVAAGMADRLGSLEEIIAEESAAGRERHNKRVYFMRGPITVNSTQQLREALKAGHTADEVTVAFDTAKLEADARAAGAAEARTALEAEHATALDAATTKARNEGIEAERKRVNDLNAIAIPGFEAVVSDAVKNGQSMEACMTEITKQARDRGTSVVAQRREAPEAAAHGGAGGATAGDVKTEAGRAGWKSAAASVSKHRARK